MLDLNFGRRDFMRIGGVAAAMGLTNFSFADDTLHNKDLPDTFKNDVSVVWVWLGGGPSQFETFHASPKLNDSAYEPVNGKITTPEGHVLGGLWKNLAEQSDKFVTVNSFGHKDPSHRQATHFMMGGKYNTERTQTAGQKEPSHGSIISALYGPNSKNGMPHYVNQGKIEGEKSAWLGGAYNPFSPSQKDNLIPKIDLKRFSQRFYMLNQLDRKFRREELAKSWGDMKVQAHDTIIGQVYKAFDIELESEKMREKYGKGVGEQFLLARRLVEAGTKFVTIHYGGWDMHSNIEAALKSRVPPIDVALGAFIEDIWKRGLQKKVLLVVTGEFGRTKLNANAGRDHWPSLTPLLMSGGDYEMGGTIGTSDKSYVPEDRPHFPADLKATMFDHFGIPHRIQRTDNAGRPRYLLEADGSEPRVIL